METMILLRIRKWHLVLNFGVKAVKEKDQDEELDEDLGSDVNENLN